MRLYKQHNLCLDHYRQTEHEAEPWGITISVGAGLFAPLPKAKTLPLVVSTAEWAYPAVTDTMRSSGEWGRADMPT